MSGETLRIISSNTYRNRALNDPESLEKLLPCDDIPTIAAFQEVTYARDQTEALIRGRGYQPIVLGSHGLALAVSADLDVQDVQTVTYSSRGPSRKYGLQVIRTAIGEHDLLLGNGHMPVFSVPRWGAIARQEAVVFGRLAVENTDCVIVSLGDRNFVRSRQARQYRELQKTWGAQTLLPEEEPTYRVDAGKHRWLSRLGLLSDMQLDGIDVRIPGTAELVDVGTAPQADAAQQYGYEVETLSVASDHLAVKALLHLPAAPALPLATSEVCEKEGSQEPGQKAPRWYHLQQAAHRGLYFDHWLQTRAWFDSLPRSVRYLTRFTTGSFCGAARNRAGGIPGDYYPRARRQS